MPTAPFPSNEICEGANTTVAEFESICILGLNGKLILFEIPWNDIFRMEFLDKTWASSEAALYCSIAAYFSKAEDKISGKTLAISARSFPTSLLISLICAKFCGFRREFSKYAKIA